MRVVRLPRGHYRMTHRHSARPGSSNRLSCNRRQMGHLPRRTGKDPGTREYRTIRISALRQRYRTPADVSAWRLTAYIPGVYLQTGESGVACPLRRRSATLAPGPGTCQVYVRTTPSVWWSAVDSRVRPAVGAFTYEQRMGILERAYAGTDASRPVTIAWLVATVEARPSRSGRCSPCCLQVLSEGPDPGSVGGKGPFPVS